MKTLTLALAFLIVSSASAHAAELSAEMRAMERNLKLISAQIQDPAKNPSSIELATKFLKNAETAQGLCPENDPARKTLFASMLGHAAELTQQLITALKNGDNAKAKQLVAEIYIAKEKGHDEFN